MPPEFVLSPELAAVALATLDEVPDELLARVERDPVMSRAHDIWTSVLLSIFTHETTGTATDIARLAESYRRQEVLAGGGSGGWQVRASVFLETLQRIQIHSEFDRHEPESSLESRRSGWTAALSFALHLTPGGTELSMEIFLARLAEGTRRAFSPSERKQKPVPVFCGYAPEDEAHAQEFIKRMQILQERGLIRLGSVAQIKGGDETETTLQRMIEEARAALLLVSPDFLATCASIWESAERRRQVGLVTVVPILLRPTEGWEDALGRLQPLPKSRRPIVGWRLRDEAWATVMRELREVLQRMWETTLPRDV